MSPQSEPEFIIHPNADEMASELAAEIATLLRRAVARDGEATLILSGGSTPRRLYRRLAHQDAPWDRVTATLADERWVDPAGVHSNEHMIREELLTGRAAAAGFLGLKTSDPTPLQAAAACNRAAAELKRPFDLVLLGMGEDGHTASLFPAAAELLDALDPDCRDTYMSLYPPVGNGAAGMARMTMTLAGILDSRAILLLISGAAKRKVYETALGGSDSSSMPIRAVLHQNRVPVQVHWSP